jgi:thiol-disulfide isomerase/thioredoxin
MVFFFLVALFFLFRSVDSKKENVLLLNDSNFQSEVSGGEPWLIEFTAPWCHHCKKLLPNFEKAADASRTAGREIKFGKVDCDESAKLKDLFAVKSFPKILFFLRSEATGKAVVSPKYAYEYEGSRSSEALTLLTEKLSGPSIAKLSPVLSGFSLLQWTLEHGSYGGIIYVLVDPIHNSDGILNRAFNTIAKGLFDSLTFATIDELTSSLPSEYMTSINNVKLPFVVRILAGDPGSTVVFTANDLSMKPYVIKTASSSSRFSDSITHGEKALWSWIMHYRYETIIRINPDNFPQSANNAEGRYLAIICHNVSETETSVNERGLPTLTSNYLRAIRHLATPTTSTLQARVRDRFLFATLECETFSSFLEQFKVNSCPRLFVLDAPNKAFWEDSSVVEETDMETFLTDIVDGKAPMQRQGALSGAQKILNVVGLGGPSGVYLVIGVVVIILLYIVWIFVIKEALGYNHIPKPILEGKSTTSSSSDPANVSNASSSDSVADGTAINEGGDGIRRRG